MTNQKIKIITTLEELINFQICVWKIKDGWNIFIPRTGIFFIDEKNVEILKEKVISTIKPFYISRIFCPTLLVNITCNIFEVVEKL